jgi:apolipoprotein N-acyltransferase
MRRGNTLAAFVLGAVSVTGFAPFYFLPLPLLTLALVWYWGMNAPSAARAFRIGWSFGLGFFLTGVSWVYVSLHDFGAMPAPVAAAVTLLFCAYLALFPATTTWLVARLPLPAAARLLLVGPAAWALLEWVRSWLFTGFPWLALGYSQVPAGPLAGFAPILGIYGVSLLAAVSAGALVLAASRHRVGEARAALWRQPALYLVVVLWIGGAGLKLVEWTQPDGSNVTVSLLQGNVPQELKWRDDGLRKTLEMYRDLTLASGSRLIIMPETALPLFLGDVPPLYLEQLAAHARRNQGDILVGVPERLPGGDYYNSVVSVGSAPMQAYRKSHLVPFGEFIPLRPILGDLVSRLAIPLQDFSRGGVDQQPFAVAGQRVAVNVCYEDVFGEEIIRQLPAATLLVNVSNVAWFGRSIAPRQHLQISQARALETGRYMLRATNTGITGVIDARGTALEVADEFVPATITRAVPGYAGSTPYVRWGNWAFLALCVAMLAAAWIFGRRPRPSLRADR